MRTDTARASATTFAANRAQGAVKFDVKLEDGVTRRGVLHESGSLRVRFPSPEAEGLSGVFVNTAGGIAGGDRFDIDIRAGEGTRLTLTTAAAEKVYRAHTEPELVKKWLLGPEGWSMPVCINDARPGGKIRYEWADAKGNGFYLTGEFISLEPFSRIVHVERMHMPDTTPDNHVETLFEPDGQGTLMTMRMTLPDAATREAMLATGMDQGMEQSYQRLEKVI